MPHPYHGALAAQYADATWPADLSALRARFIAALPARASGQPRILDLGCGSGRDALAFSEAGFPVEAMDASSDMARIAAERTGLPVAVGRAEELAVEAHYDGVWACASLLHVPMAGLADVFLRLRRALRPEGVLYASFKWGRGERTEGGLHFTDLTPESAEALVRGTSGLRPEESWASEDTRPGRAGVVWLNLLARRSNEASALG